MNILIQGSLRSFYVHHSLCKVLYERYPSSKFGYFASSLSSVTQTESLFQNSQKPTFKIYNPYSYDKSFDYDSNVALVAEFEKFSGMTIWRMLAADRSIGWIMTRYSSQKSLIEGY